MTSDPKILGLALLGGIIPSLLWLWFWLNEENNKPEPKGLLTLIFILGMLAVVVVLPIQKFVQSGITSTEWQLALWATAEEIMKLLAVVVLISGTNEIDEPIDCPIYLITAALGFAALENALFLLKPLTLGQTTVGLLTGQMRFIGSTLLHTVSSGIVGIALGLSLHMEGLKKKLYLIVGIIFAIALHSAFNFFIIRNEGSDFLKVFAFLWVATIIVLLLLEKIRRIN